MDNREKIMQCAEQLFYEKGYDATGVQEIVDRAGITKPTLYYYFGSKIGLLQDIMEIKMGQLRQSILQVKEQEGELKEKLYAMADLLGTFFQEDHGFYMLMMAMFYSARENEAYQAVAPYIHEFYRNVVGIFETSFACEEDCQRIAISFLGAMNEYLVWLYERNQLKKENGKEDHPQPHVMVDQFLYGVTGPVK